MKSKTKKQSRGKLPRKAKTKAKKPKVQKNPEGRPTDFKPEYPEQARKLCLLGATDKELADFFQVCEATINNWKIKHPKFLESINDGKTIADADVADRLFQRAKGYTHPEEKIFCNEGLITRANTTKHYPPDPTSAIFWLKNRQKDKFRDKQDHEHTGKDGGPIQTEDVTQLTEEELLARLNELERKQNQSVTDNGA